MAAEGEIDMYLWLMANEGEIDVYLWSWPMKES
jgi:hypothetical protein